MVKKIKNPKFTEWFRMKMYAIKNSKNAHQLADETLCELLIALGYIEVVRQYREIKKEF